MMFRLFTRGIILPFWSPYDVDLNLKVWLFKFNLGSTIYNFMLNYVLIRITIIVILIVIIITIKEERQYCVILNLTKYRNMSLNMRITVE